VKEELRQSSAEAQERWKKAWEVLTETLAMREEAKEMLATAQQMKKEAKIMREDLR
jgi:hypothetical protein